MIAAFTAGNPVLKPRFRIPFCFLRWSPKTGWFLDGVRTPCYEFDWRDGFCDATNTVDGRNPAPVDMVNLPSIYGFFKKSQVVVWDFFYQQYDWHNSTVLKMIERNNQNLFIGPRWDDDWWWLGFVDISKMPFCVPTRQEALRSINRTNGRSRIHLTLALESIGIEGKQR